VTVLELLQTTTAYFAKRKIETARLNAEHLLAHALNCKRLELYLQFERVLTEDELAPLRERVRRRGQGEPLQHLLGTVEFCGHTFLCNKHALVPRPETEQLAEMLITEFGKGLSGSERKVERILDVGTGSGVIALSLAAKFSVARVVATDISDEALVLAQENATRLGIDRLRFVKSDLLQNVEGKFDLIVANLPYIATGERSGLSREVLHDPEIALFAGERGDELMRALIEAAPNYLETNGLLALEIGINQHEALIALLSEKNFHDISPKKDYAGVTRFLLARYG
jgi:release factor glutamine methyltransferase